MDRIAQVFSSGRKAFIPYLTAGYPTVDECVTAMNILVDNGADIIELGFPFSDPTADGLTIQESSQYALERGFTLKDYFKILEVFRANHPTTPIVIFGYYNPIFHYGIEAYVKTVKQLGADALLIVDLPFEEQCEVRPIVDQHGIHLIQLIAPTTDTKRLPKILERATGFVYQISLRGVTGVRNSIEGDVVSMLKKMRKMTELPVAVGFGISTVDQIENLRSAVDGIVIGSAIVKTIGNNLPDFRNPLTNQVRSLAQAIHGTD